MSSSFHQRLLTGKRVITVELNPPKSNNIEEAYREAEAYIEYVDAINITDCPMASIRLGAIAVSHLIKEKFGIDTIFNLTCRDRNLIGLQSELLGAHAMGVRNILAITGDPPELGQCKEATGVFDVNSAGLIRLAKNLQCNRKDNQLHDNLFCIGATVSPSAEDPEKEIKKLHEKLEAGADFVITQPVYDMGIWQKFLETIGDCPVPLIVGILPLRSLKMAQYLNEKVPGIKIPKNILVHLQECKTHDEMNKTGLRLAMDMVSQIKNQVAGIHIMSMGEAWKVKEIARIFRE